MKNKAPLALMEQLVMLLVFALAAALCLQAFVLADQMSEENALRDRAVVRVQDAAETVKYTKGDMERAQQLLGGELSGGKLTISDETGILTIETRENCGPLLGAADVVMTDAEGKELFCVAVSWQTEA